MKNNISRLTTTLDTAVKMGVSRKLLAAAIQRVIEDHVDKMILRTLSDHFYMENDGFKTAIQSTGVEDLESVFNAMTVNLLTQDSAYSGLDEESIISSMTQGLPTLTAIDKESATELIRERLAYLTKSRSIIDLSNDRYTIPLERLYNIAMERKRLEGIRIRIAQASMGDPHLSVLK